MGCAVASFGCIGLTCIMSLASGGRPSPAPAPPTSVPAAPAISPTLAKGIATRMTKTSKTLSIPLPSDATALKEGGGFKTQIGSVIELTAYYREWMAAHQWTFEPKYSTLDPEQGVAKSLGYTTNQIWCKNTKPITTASIVIGSGSDTNRGKSVEIFISELRNEESCP